jgi:O-antigen/teichoic acid export membrane protein
MTRFASLFKGDGLAARVVRSSGWLVLGFGSSQAIRLASNLILTRLLFPEAFGLMALVTVFNIGLQMFSDVGINPSIMQNKRGDEPAFLNTAWTMQVFRGFGLWIFTCLIAWPVSVFYEEPMLMWLMPVSGLTLVIFGFMPTKVVTANRHLNVGRVMLAEIGAQIVGLAAMIYLAWQMQSVWALVIGGLVNNVAKVMLSHKLVPGMKNKFFWEPAAARDLFNFGKWIFLSTICGFLSNQSDKLILGKFLALGAFGVYNIGFFMASLPIAMAAILTQRMLLPLFREKPPSQSERNYKQIRKLRFVLTAGILTMLTFFAFFGVPLVDFLYDPRFAMAGTIIVLIACAKIPMIINSSYDQAAIAAGDTRTYFYTRAFDATMQVTCLLIGVMNFGLIGAIIGHGIANTLLYIPLHRLARKHGAWDILHDVIYAVIGFSIAGAALWYNYDAIIALSEVM